MAAVLCFCLYWRSRGSGRTSWTKPCRRSSTTSRSQTPQSTLWRWPSHGLVALALPQHPLRASWPWPSHSTHSAPHSARPQCMLCGGDASARVVKQRQTHVHARPPPSDGPSLSDALGAACVRRVRRRYNAKLKMIVECFYSPLASANGRGRQCCSVPCGSVAVCGAAVSPVCGVAVCHAALGAPSRGVTSAEWARRRRAARACRAVLCCSPHIHAITRRHMTARMHPRPHTRTHTFRHCSC